MKKIFIKELLVNTTIQSYFLVTKKDKKLKKNGSPYLQLTLADKTGSINANVWDSVDYIWQVVNDAAIIFVEGMVSEFQGSLQLTVKSASVCSEQDYDVANLIKSLSNIEDIFLQMQQLLQLIENEYLQRLINSFLHDKDFMDKFLKCPGGMLWHHAYLGGLLQHTLEVMALSHEMYAIHPEVNRDILLAGAFLHDIGKVDELEYLMHFDYTTKGKLLGHICIGYEMVLTKAHQIEGFPEDLLSEIKHIVLSHQGEYVQCSPVLPKTIEACIVYHCDNLSSQVNAFKSVVYGPRIEGAAWSRYFPIINRQLLLREDKDGVL